MNPETFATDLILDRLQLWQLPAWAFELWALGYNAHDDLITDLEHRIARAEADADHWYEVACNPGKRLDMARDERIQEALDHADESGHLTTEGDVIRVTLAAATAPRRAA